MGHRLLWISAETPDRDGHGGQRRQFHLVRELVRAGHEVEVVVPRTEQDPTSVRAVTRVSVVGGSSLRRALVRRSEVDRLVAERRPDAVVVVHLESLRMMPRAFARSSAPMVVDAQNVDSRWFTQEGDRTAARRAAWWERRVLHRASVVVCSQEERAALLALDPSGDVAVVRQGLDPDEWPPRPPRTPAATVSFFGSLWYPVNLEGLRWFIDEAWPLVRAARPDAELRLFGAGAPEGLADPGRGIRVEGWVDHLAPALHDSDVLIVPILAGPGSRVKFPEALASGLPVVATGVAAESFEADGRYRRADDPQAFADACLDLLDQPDRAAALAAAARDLALSTLTWADSARRFQDAVDGAVGRGRSGVGRRRPGRGRPG